MSGLRQRQGQAGVALVVTLMMMSVLTMMVVGLAGVMLSEQAAARNLTYQVLAEQMAEIGAQEAMAAVLSNSPTNGLPSATGPGWMWVNRTLVPLFSTNTNGQAINLETLGTNSLILSPTSPAIQILAHWSNVVAPGAAANLPVGRYAWWVDDEGTKADLNAANQRNTNLFPLTTAWPFTTRQIFGVNLTDFNNRTNLLHTTESVKEIPGIATTRFQGAKGQATVWSAHQNLNPWGQSKFPLSQLSNANIITNDTAFSSLMTQTFAHPNLTTLFGRDFVDKYGNGDRTVGSNVIRQTLANAHEAIKFLTNTTSAPVQSTNTVAFAGTNLPRDFQGLRPAALRLNEVVIFPTYNNLNINQCQMQIWVWVEIINLGSLSATNDIYYWTGPTGTMDVVMRLQNGRVFTNRLTSMTGFFKTNGSTSVNAGNSATNVAAGGFFTNQSWLVLGGNFETPGVPGLNAPPEWRSPSASDPAGTVTNMQILNFQLGDIVAVEKIQIVGGRRPVYTNIVTDWVQGPFLPLSFTNVGTSTVNLSFINGGYSGSATEYTNITAPLPGATSAQGFSRKDPRFRVFPSWVSSGIAAQENWQIAPPTFGLDNSTLNAGGTLNGGLVQDRLATANAAAEGAIWRPGTNLFSTNVTNLPSWGVGGSNLPSVGVLGSLHTGLNWRTLRMAGKGADPDPPDWFLFELFTAATNPAVSAPRINVNNRIFHAGGWGAAKTPMALALLSNLTNGTGTIPTNVLALNPRWTTNNLNMISSNLSTRPLPWVAGSSWGATRTNTLGMTNTNVLFFASELAEIDGLGNAGVSDREAESVLTAAMDLLTTRSDTFTVWSAGQGLVVFTNSLGQVRTNVMGEVRKQTVFQRVPVITGGAVTGWQIKVLYTKNHVVE